MNQEQESARAARSMVFRNQIRRILFCTNTLVSLILVIILWGMVNYLGSRHYRREDWSRQQMTRLSPKTMDVLSLIRDPVKVFVISSDDFQAVDEVKELLESCRAREPRLKIEFVDPLRDLARMEELARRYQVRETDRLLLAQNDRSVQVPLEKMILWEVIATPTGKRNEMVGFQGEVLFTSALVELLHGDAPRVYFLDGHGEKGIDNFQDSLQAYSNVRSALEEDHIRVRPLRLDGQQMVPEDCEVLVIAGPNSRIPQPELDVIERYLTGGGQLLILLDAGQDAGLKPLLRTYGVGLLPDVVVDQKYNSNGVDVWVSHYADHPITAPVQGKNTIYLRPRSVMPSNGIEGADKPVFTPLLSCSEHGWANLGLTESPIRFHPEIDMPGPAPIAAVVEKVRSAAGDEDRPTRLVVFGDSDFASNRLKSSTGVDLLRNAVNWLLAREQLLAIPPKPMETIRLELDRSGMKKLFLSVCVAMPLCVGVLGLMVAWRRKR